MQTLEFGTRYKNKGLPKGERVVIAIHDNQQLGIADVIETPEGEGLSPAGGANKEEIGEVLKMIPKEEVLEMARRGNRKMFGNERADLITLLEEYARQQRSISVE